MTMTTPTFDMDAALQALREGISNSEAFHLAL